MSSIAVVGSSFGDEGKGKIVDFLVSKYNIDAVARFNGGSGAGHEIVIDGEKFTFHQVPSGAFLGKKLYIGEGCAVDPELLFNQEVEVLKAKGFEPDLGISDNSKVVFDFLREIDGAEESVRDVKTTKRGIGPTYTMDTARLGMRMYDVADEEKLKSKLPKFMKFCQGYLKMLESDYTIDFDQTLKKYLELSKRIAPYVRDIRDEINNIHSRKTILFEGAQGTLLDQIFGVYPNVTSSRTTVDGIYGGTGLRFGKRIVERIGVFKAYESRMANTGPFITKMDDEVQDELRKKGDEFGRTTGNPRNLGWPNLVELKYATERNGFTGLAVTRIDTFAGLDKIKVCKGYLDDKGNKTDRIPSDSERYEKYQSVYGELEGWPELSEEKWNSIAKKGYATLPQPVKNYLKWISYYVKVDVKIVSVGADRKSTIATKMKI